MGADCILLIIAALTDSEAHELEQLAHALGLDVLVEVHNRAELDRALSLQSRLIGINNRNLKTLKTDINTTVELAAHVPPDRFLIGESGLRTHADLQMLAEAGVDEIEAGTPAMGGVDIAAIAAMVDQARGGGVVERHHGQPAGHGLGGDVAEGLGDRGEEKHIHSGDGAGEVCSGEEACEDRGRQAGFQPVVGGAFADDEDAVGGKAGCSTTGE